jgi:60 kDa SS-A/Ro ribonucleoprotein
MRVNTAAKKVVKKTEAVALTHEGAVASGLTDEQKLRRTVMSCMLWEGTFYEDGVSIADRIEQSIKAMPFDKIAGVAIEAREDMKLRHVPLLLAKALAKRGEGRKMGDLLERIIQRPDELTEFLSIYWKNGKTPLAKQVKIGLARALRKFDEYSLAKYNRADAIKLRDVLFLTHAKPVDAKQEKLWKKLVEGTLATPDTWETALSAGGNKKTEFERLMKENKLFALAFLRNLRNMQEAGIEKSVVREYGQTLNLDRVLPFRFIAAARAVPVWEDVVEELMLKSLANAEKLKGKTAIVVDNSGSMHGTKVSAKSDIDRFDAAAALAVLLREICEDVVVIGFGSSASVMPTRRGFALVEALRHGPGGGTNTNAAVALAKKEGYDRIIIVTDEQSHTSIGKPEGIGYVINVANYENGIGYGEWVHVDGWSESIVDYIRMLESLQK